MNIMVGQRFERMKPSEKVRAMENLSAFLGFDTVSFEDFWEFQRVSVYCKGHLL